MSKTRIFDLPADLPRMYALAGRNPWTARDLQRRLDYLSTYIEYNKVPGAKGRACGVSERGQPLWETVDLPPELAPHLQDLAKAVKATLELLAGDKIGMAGERMNGIEGLVADMAARVATVTEKGRQNSLKGGEAKRGKYRLGPDTPSLLQDAVLEKLAEKPEHSLTNVRRLVARDKGVSPSTVRRHTKGISSKKTELK